MSFLGPVYSAPQSNTEKDADHWLNKFPALVSLACWWLKGLQPMPRVACPAGLPQHHWNSLPCSVTGVSASGIRRWTPQSDGFNWGSGWGQTVFPEPRGPSAGRREEEKPLWCSLRFRAAYLAHSPFGHMFITPFQQTVLWRFTMGSNCSGIFLMFWFPRAVHLARVSLLRLESWVHHRPLFCGEFTQVWPSWGNHRILDSEPSAYHLSPVPSPHLALTLSLEACGMVRGTFYKKVLGLIWGPNRIFCNIHLSFSWCHTRRQNESTWSCTSGLVNIIPQHPRAYKHHTLASLQTGCPSCVPHMVGLLPVASLLFPKVPLQHSWCAWPVLSLMVKSSPSKTACVSPLCQALPKTWGHKGKYSMFLWPQEIIFLIRIGAGLGHVKQIIEDMIKIFSENRASLESDWGFVRGMKH